MRREHQATRPISVVGIGLVIVVVFACWPSRQAAAEASLDEEARALFEAGQGAFGDGRTADARDLFRRSLELSPRSGTAWNLALALRATNELVRATQLLTELIDGRFGELGPEERAETETLLQEISARLATLSITVRSPAPVDITIDGEHSGTIEPDSSLERHVVAGQHVIRGTAEGTEPVEQTLTVAGGEERTVALLLESLEGGEGGTGRRRSVVREPWFWLVVVGAVAIAVTTGVLAWWFVAGREETGPEVDPIWGNTEALHWADR